MQSTLEHVGIIMDGNRRWARCRGLPDAAGHRAGLARLNALLPHIASSEVRMLTVYAFSSDNWRRDRAEVEQLFALACDGFRRFTPRCVRAGLRVEVIGRRDRLPRELLRHIQHIESATVRGERVLRVAVDYSARDAILRAIDRLEE